MAGLQLSGLSTGIDTTTLVQQLMVLEEQRLASYKVDKMDKEDESDLWAEIESKLKSLMTASSNLTDVDSLKSFKESISDSDKLGLTVNSGAYEGSHAIEINQLATSARLVHDGFKYDTDYVGSGNFIYTYDNKEVVLNVPEGTTLLDLVGLINNDDNNPGITASIMQYDNGSDGVYHLVLSGQDSGSNYAIDIQSENSQQYVSTAFKTGESKNASGSTELIELTDFDGVLSSSGVKDQIRIQGVKHDGTAVDYSFDITEYTTMDHLVNEINEAFQDGSGNPTAKAILEDGQIRMIDLTSGVSQMEITSIDFVQGENSTATLTLPTFSMKGSAGGAVTSGMAEFTDPGQFVETQTAQDSLIRVDGYPQDSWISSSTNSVTGVIEGVTLNLQDVTDPGEEIRIGITRDTSKLSSALKNMIKSYNDVVSHLKDVSKYDNETGEAGALIGDSTVRSILSSIRNPFFGNVTGFSAEDDYTLANQIGLEINSDGELELDEDTFNDAIDENYDSVFDLLGIEGAGRITGGDTSNFVFNSAQDYTKPGEYEVKVEYYGDGTRAAFIRKDGGEWHSAKLENNKIIGDLTSKDEVGDYYPERGLVLTFDPPASPTGTYTATLDIKQGLGGNLDDILDAYTGGDDALISIKKESIKDSIDFMEEKIEKEQDRLEKKEARLTAKYARLEAQLQSLQQQMSAAGMLSVSSYY